MSFLVRFVVFATMLAAGLASSLYFSHPHPADLAVQASAWPVQDWIFWGVGVLLAGYGLFNFVRPGGYFDWRTPLWIVAGSAMIYAELFNVVPMKELGCQMLHGHHRPAWGQCYRAGAL